MTHVEMYDGRMFCGESERADGSVKRVWQQDWHQTTETIQQSDCPDCLMRIFMLGDSAKITLARMGLQIQVHDVADGPVDS